jgi:hypothetical protein
MSSALSLGYNCARLVRLMQKSIAECNLNLAGSIVLTEAARGAYSVTPVLSAMAGAECVYAVTKTTQYGSVEQITQETLELATLAGVEEKIQIITEKNQVPVHEIDIITNSGHVRPIDREMIEQFKPTAVIPLMYEAWEFRDSDVDLAFCRTKGIPLVGTNERHPAVDVFSYLGIMAVKLLLDAGIAVYGSRLLLLCDNPFAPYIERGLTGAGADVCCVEALDDVPNSTGFDAIIVALHPDTKPILTKSDAVKIASQWQGAVVAQFWGDIQRDAFIELKIPLWPLKEPTPGHMGILPSAIGPEPIVRLQCGGLKVGELLWRSRMSGLDAKSAAQFSVDKGFGDFI